MAQVMRADMNPNEFGISEQSRPCSSMGRREQAVCGGKAIFSMQAFRNLSVQAPGTSYDR